MEGNTLWHRSRKARLWLRVLMVAAIGMVVAGENMEVHHLVGGGTLLFLVTGGALIMLRRTNPDRLL